MSIEVTAGRDVLRRLRNGDKLIRRGIRQGWYAVGDDWKSEANREILRKPKGGRVYIIRTAGGRTRRHTASAPGETHANLTGALRKALSWKVRGNGTELDVGYAVAGKTEAPPYAHAIEFGKTNAPNTIEPRPSIQNAIKATQRNAEQHLADAVQRELEK